MLHELRQKLGCGCPYCGVPMSRQRYRPSKDHMLPKSRGGTLEHGNKVIVCVPCNMAKGDLTIHEFHKALVQHRDPRARHVGRFIEGMNLYFEGRLRIPQVLREVRDSYPRVRYRRRVPMPEKRRDTLFSRPVHHEPQMAPAFGM